MIILIIVLLYTVSSHKLLYIHVLIIMGLLVTACNYFKAGLWFKGHKSCTEDEGEIFPSLESLGVPKVNV